MEERLRDALQGGGAVGGAMTMRASFGIWPSIMRGVSFNDDLDAVLSTPYCKKASEIFSFLAEQQRPDGAIIDGNIPDVPQPLDAQYHHANMTLAGIILHILNPEKHEYLDRALGAMRYYLSVPTEKRKAGVDFSNLPFLIAAAVIKGNENGRETLGDALAGYVKDMRHHADLNSSGTYGNNFVALRSLNLLIRFKITGDALDAEQAAFFMEHTLKWQMDDGVFYDFPRKALDPRGIPSLAYHSKITLMTLLYGIISGEKRILDRALAGLDCLVNLSADDGEAFYYGRTNNALYGYASAVLALRVAANLLGNVPAGMRFKRFERVLYRFAASHTAKDGHLYIAPNPLEDERCGFDNYMYVTVYNAFMMTTLLLSAVIKDAPLHEEQRADETHYMKQSGFLIRKRASLSAAFNLKGHNHYEQYLLDPRFTALTPLFLKFNGRDLLPSIPFTCPKPQAKSLRSLVGEMKGCSRLNDFNPLHAGFIPAMKDSSQYYMPLDVTDASVTEMENGTLIIKTAGRFTTVKRSGLMPVKLLLSNAMKSRFGVMGGMTPESLISRTALPFSRTMIVTDSFIHFNDTFELKRGAAPFFTVRAWADAKLSSDARSLTFEDSESGWMLLVEEGERAGEGKKLGSSKGKALYLEIVNDGQRKAALEDGSVSMRHTLIPFDGHSAPARLRASALSAIQEIEKRI
ncbi:MAG: hypothetical protein HY886_10100 [Deltaproteobacteria bacterium]|nr:hypothetical protein [Deltaproteobacteria bacterium]